MSNTQNIFINYIPEKNVHAQVKKSDPTRTFKTISLPSNESVNGYASVSVNNGQVLDSRTAGYKSILLGKPDKVIKLSILSPVTNAFTTITKTAAEVAEMVKAARNTAAAPANAQANA